MHARAVLSISGRVVGVVGKGGDGRVCSGRVISDSGVASARNKGFGVP